MYGYEKGVGTLAYYSTMALDCLDGIISIPTPKDIISPSPYGDKHTYPLVWAFLLITQPSRIVQILVVDK